MDPNATYKELTNILVNLTYEANDGKDIPDDVLRLMELFDALDNWIKSGGFLPEDWQQEHECQHGTWCVG